MSVKNLLNNIVSGNSKEVNHEINKFVLPFKIYIFIVLVLLIISVLGNYYILLCMNNLRDLLKEKIELNLN